MVANEHRRERDDGSTMYYREMYLPIHLLKCVYVKKDATREEVERFFAELRLDIPARRVCWMAISEGCGKTVQVRCYAFAEKDSFNHFLCNSRDLLKRHAAAIYRP